VRGENDFRTNGLITERLLCAKVSNAPADNDTLLDGRTGPCNASCTRAFFSFISVSVGGADTYYGNITGELGQTLLQFFATVIRGGFLVVRNGHLPEREIVLFTFYDFPARHWPHLRTTNPIESTFATRPASNEIELKVPAHESRH
jgi:hypothetical protein